MQRESAKLLEDMLAAALAIQQLVVGRSDEDLRRERPLRHAIYFEFMIIGEALSKMRQSDEPLYEAFTENWRIVGFRNQIVHGYFKLDETITWRIVVEKLPLLIEELKREMAAR
jgi:uncharacterized protein with HEPN domain